jgi:hypothetical protein
MLTFQHQEFILLSILPAPAAVLLRKRGALDGWRRRLPAVDRTLLAAAPALGRFCWETVFVLER